MRARFTAVRDHRDGKGQDEQAKNDANGHMDIAIGLLQIDQQLGNIEAQRNPEREGANGKETAGEAGLAGLG